jgi:hypothetical protein
MLLMMMSCTGAARDDSHAEAWQASKRQNNQCRPHCCCCCCRRLRPRSFEREIDSSSLGRPSHLRQRAFVSSAIIRHAGSSNSSVNSDSSSMFAAALQASVSSRQHIGNTMTKRAVAINQLSKEPTEFKDIQPLQADSNPLC